MKIFGWFAIAALVLLGAWWFLFRRAGSPLGTGGLMYVDVPLGAPQEGQTAPARQASNQNAQLADIFANKQGTKVVCAAVASVYTAGAGIPACGAVADIAHKVTEVQIGITKKVAGKVWGGIKSIF